MYFCKLLITTIGTVSNGKILASFEEQLFCLCFVFFFSLSSKLYLFRSFVACFSFRCQSVFASYWQEFSVFAYHNCFPYFILPWYLQIFVNIVKATELARCFSNIISSIRKYGKTYISVITGFLTHTYVKSQDK